ncbi:response regulator [candidate division WWE3 bacterium]|uniref:Response regulator n=1 Tax=candidate division WWE3 bacterium TaxID=2053526 RepID=A0A955RPG9_UNCKA|nr:response regulator [candidate division WWE3 bacterium]
MAKKILVAEDEKPMAKILSMKLEHQGFEVTTVHDGAAVLDEVRKGPFDLVLLDLIMPKTDGFEVLNRMKHENIEVPVIVTSNLSKEMEVKKAKDLGAVDYLVKTNVHLSEIVDRIEQYFNSSN